MNLQPPSTILVFLVLFGNCGSIFTLLYSFIYESMLWLVHTLHCIVIKIPNPTPVFSKFCYILLYPFIVTNLEDIFLLNR